MATKKWFAVVCFVGCAYAGVWLGAPELAEFSPVSFPSHIVAGMSAVGEELRDPVENLKQESNPESRSTALRELELKVKQSLGVETRIELVDGGFTLECRRVIQQHRWLPFLQVRTLRSQRVWDSRTRRIVRRRAP